MEVKIAIFIQKCLNFFNRIHNYQTDAEEDRENNFLRVGEIIWLKLSEVNVSINSITVPKNHSVIWQLH